MLQSKSCGTLTSCGLAAILFFVACQHPGDESTSQKNNPTGSNNYQLKWSKSFGGNDGDEGKSILSTDDGGLLIAGFTYSNASGDVPPFEGYNAHWIFKTDTTGKILWSKTYSDFFTSIIKTKDNGYLAIGFADDSSGKGSVSGNHGNSDVLVTKLNSEGIIQWQK